MKHNPDDRRDNVGKIKENIENTVQDIELAHEKIQSVDSEKIKNDLEVKNERRYEAVEALKREYADEIRDKGNGYQQ